MAREAVINFFQSIFQDVDLRTKSQASESFASPEEPQAVKGELRHLGKWSESAGNALDRDLYRTFPFR